MRTSAILLRICGASALALAPAALLAQDRDEPITDRSPDVMDIATTPLTDLNLASDPIPEALTDAVTAPFASEKLVDCAALTTEIARLDAVLGPDLDVSTGQQDRLSIGRMAKSAVASFVPFRGILRELSGAAQRQREFEEAILAGAIRRGYLKGLGEARDCPYPARPAFARIAVTRDDEVAWSEDEVEEDGRARATAAVATEGEVTDEGVPVVSIPVVQGVDQRR